MELVIIHNSNKRRFETIIDGNTAFVEYNLFNNGINYTHTEVPKELEGKGIGKALAKFVLDYARENHLKVMPLCPFIKVYIDRNPEYADISMLHGVKKNDW
jgi:predicted GNAT family acetyltransferase